MLLSSNWSLAGRLKKLFTVLINGRNTYFEINEPVSLRQLVNDEPDTDIASRKVARVLRVHFRRVRTAVIGPDLSHKRVLVSHLLHTAPVRKAIENHAAAKGISREKPNDWLRSTPIPSRLMCPTTLSVFSMSF